METNRSEEGQALVLIVLGIVALLGFTALAIDGGRVFADRRNAQNASDTAALAGAAEVAEYMADHQIWNWSDWSTCNSWLLAAKPAAYTAAIDRAYSNNYVIDTDATDLNGVTAACNTVTYQGFTDTYVDVTTWITTQSPTSFAQFVFDGPLQQTVEAVARIRPQTSTAYGNAIVALNEAACQGNQNGAIFNGSNTISINGGGVFSNGCFRADGSALTINVTDGGNTYMVEYDPNGSPTVNPGPLMGNAPLPSAIVDIDPPSCTGLPNRSWSNGTVYPGVYSGNINMNGSDSVTMEPGLYCFNGRFKATGGTLVGTGVTIYMVSGDFEIGGNVDVQLAAPGGAVDPSPALPNVVIFMDASNAGNVTMEGTSDSFYTGTVFAPTANIDVGGNSGINPTYSTQLIGWNVKVHGNVAINIVFDDEMAYQFPPRLDLLK